MADTFAQVRKEFPNAKVIASTYEAFIDELETVKGSLPVVTQEIGGKKFLYF